MSDSLALVNRQNTRSPFRSNPEGATETTEISSITSVVLSGAAQISEATGASAAASAAGEGNDTGNTEGSGAQVQSTTESPSQSTEASTSTQVAVTTQTSINLEVSTTSSGGSGLGSGAVAGIAIGALIFGAAIAFVAAFFLFKRRNRSRDVNVTTKGYSNYADSTPEFALMQQKGVGMGGRSNSYVQVSQTAVPAPTFTPLPTPAPVPQSNNPNITAFLPPTAAENDVYSQVSALFNRIHSHVELYYRDVHASITSSMEPELAQFGAKDVNMAELLQDCSSPTSALKHALVDYVLGITGPKRGIEGETLFPKELDGVRVAEESDDEPGPDILAATTLHRRISVYLFNSASPAIQSRRGWLIDSSTHEAADHFAITFFPWVNPASRESDKEQDLASIVAQALQIRIWLFGEPHLYDFKWEETGKRGILVSPSLIRRTGEPGDDSERVVVEGVVVAV